jgi:hypothetical protein
MCFFHWKHFFEDLSTSYSETIFRFVISTSGSYFYPSFPRCRYLSMILCIHSIKKYWLVSKHHTKDIGVFQKIFVEFFQVWRRSEDYLNAFLKTISRNFYKKHFMNSNKFEIQKKLLATLFNSHLNI